MCGYGSFGIVYGGTWFGFKCAIKTMILRDSEHGLPHAGGPGGGAGHLPRQQCIREAALCCTMQHPNIVTTHHYYVQVGHRAWRDRLSKGGGRCCKQLLLLWWWLRREAAEVVECCLGALDRACHPAVPAARCP